jgi:hypothetical protein
VIETLYKPFVAFVAVPMLAFVPAVIATAAWLWRARGTTATVPVALAAIAWALYGAWELSFHLVPVREWIRVDLLVIAPVLVALSIAAFVALMRRRPRAM